MTGVRVLTVQIKDTTDENPAHEALGPESGTSGSGNGHYASGGYMKPRFMPAEGDSRRRECVEFATVSP